VQFSTIALPQDVPHRKHINHQAWNEERKEGGMEGREERTNDRNPFIHIYVTHIKIHKSPLDQLLSHI
jgi:hypothetical protein